MNQLDKYYDKHYAEMNIQPIDLMQVLMTKEAFQGLLYGMIVKYQMRAGNKAGESFGKDLVKRDRYLQWYYMSLVLKKHINPNDVGDDVPLDFRTDIIETIERERWNMTKVKQIIEGVN